MFYVLNGTQVIHDDAKQLIQLQKSLIPIGFGKVLNFGFVKQIGRWSASKRFIVLYEEGLAVFSNNRLIEALVFVPTVKYFLSTQKDGVSFTLSILPYFQMTLTSTKEDCKTWIEKFEQVGKYVEIKQEDIERTSSMRWKTRLFK
jgi:hypothetical protein